MIKKIAITITILLLTGCAEIKQSYSEFISLGMGIEDPTERGLAYVAIAIIISAVIRGFLNK